QRRLESPVVADRERRLALRARRDRAGRLLVRQAERLLDEDVLAGLRGGDDLLAVPRMRSGKNDGVDVAAEEVLVAPEKRDAVLLAEVFGACGGASRARDETDALAAFDRPYEVLPPVADPDDPRAQHARMIQARAAGCGPTPVRGRGGSAVPSRGKWSQQRAREERTPRAAA